MLEAKRPVVVVPMFSPPAKMDRVVVVDNKFPTVSCVPVASNCEPVELETMIEFGEKEEALVPPLATGKMPETPVVSDT